MLGCLAVYIFITVQILGGYSSYQSVQIYEKYEEEFLYTNIDKFRIHDETTVDISYFFEYANKGDTLHLTISDITNDLIEIQIDDVVLYQVPLLPSAIWIQQPMFLSLIAVFSFFLIATNLRNPKSKSIKNLQREMNII